MMKTMNKNELIEILQDWNFWRKDLATGVPRQEYLARISSFLDTNQVLTITGPRRAGKSFIMRQTAKALEHTGVDKQNILIVNFEDPRFTELSAGLLEQIHDTYRELLAPKGQLYFFLDEVQEIAGGEKWARSMPEHKNAIDRESKRLYSSH